MVHIGPTEAPPEADTKAAKVDKNPVFTSKSVPLLCALKITSAGPWYLAILRYFFTIIITVAVIKRKIKGATLKHKPPTSKRHEPKLVLKLEAF